MAALKCHGINRARSCGSGRKWTASGSSKKARPSAAPASSIWRSSSLTTAAAAGFIVRTSDRSPSPGTLRGRLLDPDDHRLGPDEVLDVCLAEADLAHPGNTVGTGVSEAAACLNEHVQ